MKSVNQQYEMKGIAVVEKMPTPVKVLETSGKDIVRAVYEKGYLTDYLGTMNDGRTICFDVKECESTAFNLDNVAVHQYNLLRRMHMMRARSFLLVYMKKVDQYYRVPFPVLQFAWERRENGGRASIEQKLFDSDCVPVNFNEKNGILRDYLVGFY